jgi:hypothetical protein
MSKHNKLKALVLSLGLAAMMVPATMNAQINRGLLQNPYKDESSKNHGMLNPRGNRGTSTISGQNFTNGGFGEEEPEYPEAPLGSGLAILIGAGLGYVALKKKEDKQ